MRSVMGVHPPIAADLLPVQLDPCAGKLFGYSPNTLHYVTRNT